MQIRVAKNSDKYLTQMREDIAKMEHILNSFGTEEGFEDYVEQNTIKLTVGKDEVDLYFSPRTWEAAEQFLMFCICHLIESDDLDKFPYYHAMADRYAAALGIERGSFE